MKLRIFTLLLVALAYLSSCQKNGVLPAVKPQDPSELLNNQLPGLNHDTVGVNQTTPPPAFQGTVTNLIQGGYLKLQLFQNQTNTDNIIIAFDSKASPAYVIGEDAPTLQGFGQVSLSSLSSDHIPLAINTTPLPPTSCTIGLKVNAQTDGTYQLNMTSIAGLPSIFQIWLKDNFKKDSLDFRSNSSYVFDLLKADTNTYGSNRFSLVIRQDWSMEVHLLNFKATKTTAGAKIDWQVENELNYTGFSIERSTDNGQTFTLLTRFNSNGSGNYSFTDKSPVKGTDQYRLAIEDLNGLISVSKILPLNF